MKLKSTIQVTASKATAIEAWIDRAVEYRSEAAVDAEVHEVGISRRELLHAQKDVLFGGIALPETDLIADPVVLAKYIE